MVVSGLVLGLITLQAGNADDYIAAAMTIDYAATHIGLENRKFSNNYSSRVRITEASLAECV